jgi:hypothetical protein
VPRPSIASGESLSAPRFSATAITRIESRCAEASEPFSPRHTLASRLDGATTREGRLRASRLSRPAADVPRVVRPR